MSLFGELFKKKKVHRITLTLDDLERIAFKTAWCDVHASFDDFVKIKMNIQRILKKREELPLHLGIHKKIDQAVALKLKGFEVDFSYGIWGIWDGKITR